MVENSGYCINLHDVGHYPRVYMENIQDKAELNVELTKLKDDVINNPDDYPSLEDIEVVIVEDDEVIEFDYWWWSDNSDYPQFLKERQ